MSQRERERVRERESEAERGRERDRESDWEGWRMVVGGGRAMGANSKGVSGELDERASD